MDSEIPAWGRLSWAIAFRVAVLCLLCTAIVQLFATTRLYATVLILVGLFAVAAHDLKRLIARTRRDVSRGMDQAATQQSHDRVKRERQLQYSEALLDTVTAALFVVRDDGTAVSVNRAARRLAGESINTLGEVAAFSATTATLLQAMQPGARHVTYLADGQPVYVAATEFRGEPGCGKQRLISIQRIAGELDAIELKAWQDVASVLTHEMMNSLTPIASLSENLEQLLRAAQPAKSMDATSLELSGALEAIKRRSQGLMSFVERYRAVAELPAPDTQLIDLKQIFAGVDRLMSPMLREAGVAYQCQIQSASTSLFADANLLEQALINLIRNAAEAACEAEQPAVCVTCEMREAEWVIAVADNGPGLTEEQRERIFVPFYTTKPEGSGIGLSLARQIAFAHGGRVEVQSNEPKGSIFSLVLPGPARASVG